MPTDTNLTEVEDGTEEGGEEEEEESRDEDSNASQPGQRPDTSFDDNKLYNNPRFLDTIKRPELNITHPPADHGLTNFHVAVLLTALAFLFLLFLLGFIILRRQARLFNTPYMAPNTYSKEANLPQHEHHCAPTRMPLPRGLPVQMARTAYDNKVLHQHP